VVHGAGEAVGAIINGQWKLIRLIGEGGLAAVYEAHAVAGSDRRAIKILHPQFVTQRAIVERFYAEAKACFSLRHPNVCVVEAYAYAEDGSPYMVMELLDGLNLEDLLRKKQPLRPEQAAPLLYAILQALSVAHARGIVHRDLKPANLFLVPTALSSNNGEYSVKVLDFGIAKVMDIAGGMGSKTRTGAVLGTPGYMAPEQVRNAKAVDARTDLWAAGVVYFEMLTCQHPYGSADQLARMVAVLRDAPAKLSAHAPDLAHWDAFFDKALARDPEQRFQSAQEMAERLREVSQGTPARFVADGLQTVALPMMPDLMRQHAPATAPQAAPAPSATPPATAASYAVQHQPSQHPSVPPQHASVPPLSGVPHVYQDALRKAGGTQISADAPEGTPAYHSDFPPVQVVEARDEEPPALVWWAVAVVALSTFAIGVLLGYLLGAT
jgi:serine/threonine-protein kinase